MLARMKSVVQALRRANDPMNWNDRQGALYRSWGYVTTNLLRGDYYEFGVFDGGGLVRSFWAFSQFRRWAAGQRKSSEKWQSEPAAIIAAFEPKFYGLDTFEGMPENDEGNPMFGAGSFNRSLESVKRNCAAAGLQGENLCLLKGLFSETAPKLLSSNPRPAAIINVDCDLYASAKDALAICKHVIQDGTVLLVDDHNAFCASPSKGERRAMAEFEQETGIKFEPWFSYQFNAQAFLCHR
jgi:O-methyltransferase